MKFTTELQKNLALASWRQKWRSDRLLPFEREFSKPFSCGKGDESIPNRAIVAPDATATSTVERMHSKVRSRSPSTELNSSRGSGSEYNPANNSYGNKSITEIDSVSKRARGGSAGDDCGPLGMHYSQEMELELQEVAPKEVQVELQEEGGGTLVGSQGTEY